jgi:ParB family transcriptional regulator, chromosome partitioning protein
MTQAIVWMALDALKPDQEQLDRHRDPEKLAGLTDSIKRYGILEPLGARPDGSLLWGHGRYLAAPAAGMNKMPVIVTDRVLTPTEIECIKAVENAHTQELEDRDLYRIVARLKELNPGASQQAIGQMIAVKDHKMTHLFAVDKLIPAAKDAFMSGAFGLGKAYQISKAPDERGQHDLLTLALGNQCSRDELARRVSRKARNGASDPAPKVSRATFVLNGASISVAVANGALGMDDVIDYLTSLVREAKKQRDAGVSIKNFAAVLKDLAKQNKAQAG